MNGTEFATWLRTLPDRLRESLFWLPLSMTLAGGLLALGVTAVHDQLGPIGWLPPVSSATAPVVLEAIAVGSLTLVGLVSSLTVVALQLSSSQFSPRVLRGFLRDRIAQTAIGAGVATATYVLAILASGVVAAPAGGGDAPAEPDLAVGLALLLAGTTVVLIIAFIDHTARSMRVGTIIRRVTAETRDRIAASFPRPVTEPQAAPEDDTEALPEGEPLRVLAERDGWITSVDLAGLLELLPPGGAVRLDLNTGKFAIEGTALVTVWPRPGDDGAAARLAAAIHDHYSFGEQRTMQQDVAFGIRQLVDISLRALSPAINDPGTAYEVISNLGAVLADLLRRDLDHPVTVATEGRRVHRPLVRDHGRYLDLAFEQIRVAAAPHPYVTVALLVTIGRLQEVVAETGQEDHAEALLRQAALAVEDSLRLSHARADVDRVLDAADRLGVDVEALSPGPARP